MTVQASFPRSAAIVLGCGEIGSDVALALHQAGLAVVLVAAGLDPALLVDARGRRRRGTEVLRGHVPVTIGIGPGFVDGENVDVALALCAGNEGGSGGPGRGRIARMRWTPTRPSAMRAA